MAIDVFKAVEKAAKSGAGKPNSLFQRQQPTNFLEMAAAAAPSQMSSIFSLTGKAVPLEAPNTFTSAPPAVERAYQEEKNRATQLAAQDQLTKKYKVADLAKAYNAAKGDERERLGMEIFALTNPGLAKKVKPGQTGYETIQATRQANTPFGSALSAIPSSSTTNYQSAFTAMPADKIVSQAFGGVSGEGMQSILNTTPDLSKAVAGFPVGEKPLVGMSIKDVFTSSVFNPSQDNLSDLQLALLKEAFNKRLK